jgi:hypothetical protein
VIHFEPKVAINDEFGRSFVIFGSEVNPIFTFVTVNTPPLLTLYYVEG